MTHTTKEEPPDKPLKSKTYYLDLRNPKVNINQLKKDIVVLGGQVEKFLSKQINYVITDFYNTEDKLKSRNKSFPSPEILTSDRKVCKPVPCVKLPFSRGQTLLLKSIRRNVEGSSNVLTNARLWGIKVINQSEFLLQLDQLKANCKLNQRKLNNGSRQFLRGSYIKYEDVPRKFKVHFKKFLSFPALSITKGYLGSPFDNIQYIKNCETNLSRLKQESKNYIKPAGKTRTHNYCECCKLYYTNMEVHLKSQEHERFANNERNYENVQSLIASLETLEALIANIKPEKEEQEASRSSRQIITNNEVNESQAASESQNKGTPACAASGDSSATPKFISNARIIAQSGTGGDVTQTNECNSEKQVLEQEPREINRGKFSLETEPDRLNPYLDTKSSMSGTINRTTPNDGKYEIASALPPKKRALTLQMRIPTNANEIILPLENVAQESGCDLHKKQQNSYNTSAVNSRPQSKLDLSVMNSGESIKVDIVQKPNASNALSFCANNNQNNGHECDFDWDFDVEVDSRQNEGSGNVPTLDFCSNNNDDNIDNEGWEIFKESILENAAHNVPELSDLDICLPESETDIKTEGDRNANCDEQKTELKTGTAWCTFSASESSEILELKNIETICKKLEAESYSSVANVERKGGDDFHETDSEVDFVQEPEQNVIVDNRNAYVNDDNSFIPIIRNLRHLPERPHSCPVDATQRTPLEENRSSSCPAEEELFTSSAGSTPKGDLEIEIVRSGKLPVSLLKNCPRPGELDKAALSPSYDADKLIETFITDNDDSNQQKLMITLKCKNHYWSATESLSPWRVQNSGDLKLQFKRSELDQTEVKNENNVEWRVRTSGDCKLTLYTMKRKGYSKKENINVFYPKCKKRKINL